MPKEPVSPVSGTPYRALLKKAGTLLSRRAYSRGELRDKLSKVTTGPDLEAVLVHLEQHNLLNDEDYAYNFALCRIKQQGWGPARVKRSLLQKQVTPAIVEHALERVRSEVDDESVLLEYVERHCAKKGLPANPKDVGKLISHLRRRGFEYNLISTVLRGLLPADARRRFETGE